MRSMSISQFKATCLAELDAISRGGEPILITKRGKPIAEVTAHVPQDRPRFRIGGMADRTRILGDIVAPVVAPEEWEALR